MFVHTDICLAADICQKYVPYTVQRTVCMYTLIKIINKKYCMYVSCNNQKSVYTVRKKHFLYLEIMSDRPKIVAQSLTVLWLSNVPCNVLLILNLYSVSHAI